MSHTQQSLKPLELTTPLIPASSNSVRGSPSLTNTLISPKAKPLLFRLTFPSFLFSTMIPLLNPSIHHPAITTTMKPPNRAEEERGTNSRGRMIGGCAAAATKVHHRRQSSQRRREAQPR
ncbi:hypothetical protein AHAS_Ahas16G0129400 [Arachis hypogaea]